MLDVPRILIVNRQPILAEALALLIHHHTHFQAAFCVTYLDVIPHIAQFNPDVVVVVLQPPYGTDEHALCLQIADASNEYRVAVLASNHILQNDHVVLATFESGADGIIYLDRVCSKTFVTLLQTLAAGQHLWNPGELRAAMAQRNATPEAQVAARLADKLTTREHEILALLAHGHTNAEVAEQCGISERTVQKHVSNLLAKLDVGSRAKAIAAFYSKDRRSASRV